MIVGFSNFGGICNRNTSVSIVEFHGFNSISVKHRFYYFNFESSL